jgi:cell division septation protein DedD
MNARARNLTPEIESIMESQATSAFRLSRNQLIIGWGAVSVMLVAVYLFGFYSGRRQGVELALTEQSTPRLRLPVENPRARAALSSTIPSTEVIAPPDTTKFDFTASAVGTETVSPANETKQEANDDATAGFVAKAANEVAPTISERKPEAPIERESLAERVAKVEMSPSLIVDPPKIEKPAVVAPAVQQPVASVVKSVPPKAAPVVVSKITIPDAKPVSKKIVPEVKPASGLFVQVGAPDSFSKAQAMVSKLKASGLTAAIRDASVNNKLHYRVLVGPFGSRESAQSAKNQVVKSGVALGEPFIKNY